MIATIASTRGRWRRAAIATSLALIALTIAIAIGATYQLRRDALDGALEQTRSLSLVFAEHAARMLGGIDTVLLQLATETRDEGIADPAAFAARMRSPEMRAYLVDHHNRIGDADAFSVLDAEGNVIAWSRDGAVPPANYAYRDHFVHLRDHDDPTPYVAEPAINRVTGEWSVFIARGARSADGRFLGMFVAIVKLGYFVDFFRGSTGPDGAAVALMRDDGALLARFPVVEAWIGRRIGAASPVLAELRAGAAVSSQWVISDADGSLRLVSGRPIRGFPMVVLASIPRPRHSPPGGSTRSISASAPRRRAAASACCGSWSGSRFRFRSPRGAAGAAQYRGRQSTRTP